MNADAFFRLIMKTPALLLAILLPVALFTGCGATEGPPLPVAPRHEAAVVTAHTTRLPGRDPEEQALILANTVYAATQENNAVGAVILVPQDVAVAFTAMHRITHMPVNAPLLYLMPDGRLGDRTKREMGRLYADGVSQDGKVQVYVVGEVDPSIAETIREDLGYNVREFRESNPVALAELLDRWQAAMKSDHPDEVVVSVLSEEGIAHGMGAMGWNAHMGKGFAWVYPDSIPDATRRILARRYAEPGPGAYIYLTGPSSLISDEVARDLAEYGLVRRIAGPDPFATNAINAGYKDYGRNWGWWWGWNPRGFGWGIAQAGHNYIIASRQDLLGAIPAVVLGHMGKHGPLLLVEPNAVPAPVADYLEMVRPSPTGPQETILNHAWIIGSEATLSMEVQRQVDRLLRPDPSLHAPADSVDGPAPSTAPDAESDTTRTSPPTAS